MNVAFAADTPLSGEGVLLFVRFVASLENYGGLYIDFTDILFNESILAIHDRGYCSITQLTNLDVTPTTGTLLVGETLQFEASGGQAPYSWSVSNPALAGIDINGLLTALEGGTVKVNAQDAIGATGASGNIEIYDTKVTIPDTSVEIGSTFDLPIFIGDLPSGKEIFSFQATMTIDTAALKNIEMVNSGSLSDGWSLADNLNGKEFTFALAGTTPITTSGVLIILRFRIDADINNGHKSTLKFDDFILNEGKPRALVEHG
ncbi:MAG: hypothetical protein DRH24_20550, partial [Deltaproteobacteria bacterium]